MARQLKFGAALDGRDVAVEGVAHKGDAKTYDPDWFEITRVVDEDTGAEVDVDTLSDTDIDDIQQQAWDVLRIQDGVCVPGQTWRL